MLAKSISNPVSPLLLFPYKASLRILYSFLLNPSTLEDLQPNILTSSSQPPTSRNTQHNQRRHIWGIELEAYEVEPLVIFTSTYELNTSAKGMTPSPHSSLRRCPKPLIMPMRETKNNPSGQRSYREIQERIDLAWVFKCTLCQLSDARLYDGTSVSAKRFEDATGLTPEKFAQAWLEREGCNWVFYHPAREGKEGKEEVLVAMCGFWAAKIKHWRTLSADAVKAGVMAKCGQDGWNKTKGMIHGALSEIMSVDGGDKETFGVLRCPDCTAHPCTVICSCPTALDLPVKHEVKYQDQLHLQLDLRTPSRTRSLPLNQRRTNLNPF